MLTAEPVGEVVDASRRAVEREGAAFGVVDAARSALAVRAGADDEARGARRARVQRQLDELRVGARVGVERVRAVVHGHVAEVRRRARVERGARLVGDARRETHVAVAPGESEVARDRHGAAPRRRRHGGRVVPVAHPTDRDAPVVGCAGDRRRGVEVGAVVDPVEVREVRARGCDVVGHERRAVEVAHEVLHPGPAGDRAGVDAQQEHPPLLARAVDADREEVGHLPEDRGVVGADTEPLDVAQPLPGQQVVGAVQLDHLVVRDDRRHDPVAAGLVPEHLGVAEARRLGLEREDRLAAVVLLPGAALVERVRERLRLRPRLVAGPLAVDARVERDERGVAGLAEAARVLLVHDDRPGEDLRVRGRLHGERLLGPLHEVGARRVAPGHVAPVAPVRVVLVVEVVGPVVEDEPVGVVHPVLGRRVVRGRPPLLGPVPHVRASGALGARRRGVDRARPVARARGEREEHRDRGGRRGGAGAGRSRRTPRGARRVAVGAGRSAHVSLSSRVSRGGARRRRLVVECSRHAARRSTRRLIW